MQPATGLFAFMIILFVLGICLFIGSRMKDMMLVPIKDKLAGSGGKAVITSIEFAFTTFDQLFFFVAVGLGIVSVLLAYLTPARPAFLFLSIFLFAIAILVIPQFANIFQDVTEKAQFSPYTSNYPMTMHIFQNYGLFFWVFGFLILVVLFAKIRGGEGNV